MLRISCAIQVHLMFVFVCFCLIEVDKAVLSGVSWGLAMLLSFYNPNGAAG